MDYLIIAAQQELIALKNEELQTKKKENNKLECWKVAHEMIQEDDENTIKELKKKLLYERNLKIHATKLAVRLMLERHEIKPISDPKRVQTFKNVLATKEYMRLHDYDDN